MAGRNPLWMAQQHGHSVATMMAAYAKWIGKDREAVEYCGIDRDFKPIHARKAV
jgi:hypothetical protein